MKYNLFWKTIFFSFSPRLLALRSFRALIELTLVNYILKVISNEYVGSIMQNYILFNLNHF